jgi:hypothetical protein
MVLLFSILLVVGLHGSQYPHLFGSVTETVRGIIRLRYCVAHDSAENVDSWHSPATGVVDHCDACDSWLGDIFTRLSYRLADNGYWDMTP